MQLLKYDLKGLMAYCFPAYGVGCLATVTNVLLGFLLHQYKATFPLFLVAIFELIYKFTMLTVFFIFIASLFWVVTDFYKSVYGKIGYLTHTLPVKPRDILTSKLISGFLVWTLSAVVVCLLFLIMAVLPNGAVFTLDLPWEDQYFSTLIFYSVIAFLVTELLQLLTFFTAMSLGHLTKYKIPFTIVFYLILYHTVVNLPLFFVLMQLLSSHSNLMLSFTEGFSQSLQIYCGSALTICAAFYLITCSIMKNKLNLE